MRLLLASAISGDHIMLQSSNDLCHFCTHHVPWKKVMYLMQCGCGPFHKGCIEKLERDSRRPINVERLISPVSVEFRCPRCHEEITSVHRNWTKTAEPSFQFKNQPPHMSRRNKNTFTSNPSRDLLPSYSVPYGIQASTAYLRTSDSMRHISHNERASPVRAREMYQFSQLTPSSGLVPFQSFQLPEACSKTPSAPPANEFASMSPSPVTPYSVHASFVDTNFAAEGFENRASSNMDTRYPRPHIPQRFSQGRNNSNLSASTVSAIGYDSLRQLLPSVPSEVPPSPIIPKNSSRNRVESLQNSGRDRNLSKKLQEKKPRHKVAGGQLKEWHGNGAIRSRDTSRTTSALGKVVEFASMSRLDCSGRRPVRKIDGKDKPIRVVIELHHIHHSRREEKYTFGQKHEKSTMDPLKRQLKDRNGREGLNRGKSSKRSSR